MPRYILIDDHSGFIFGDTADLNGPARDETPAEAVRRFDESLGEHRRRYDEHGPNYRLNGASGYHVYRADIDGAEAVPMVADGQDQATIEAVQRLCRKVAVVEDVGEADPLRPFKG